jgi:hypothetical protein
VALVREFRRQVEADEIAFYKTFATTADFTKLLRERLLREILDRSGLTRTDIGGIAIDWAAVYDREPVELVPNGLHRQELADKLRGTAPADAAGLLIDLAEDVDTRGFLDQPRRCASGRDT